MAALKTETTPLTAAPAGEMMDRSPHKVTQLQERDTITNVCEAFACGITCGLFGLCGLYTVGPRETILILHNGRLTKMEGEPGCHWAAACCRSMRAVTNQDIVWNMPMLKMVDKTGVPILVSAILVYRIVDAKKAALDIDDYRNFVESLGTAALKQVVQLYSYEELKVEARTISDKIVRELQLRVLVAGAQIDSMTLNELNYAPEIASAMLKKQQAGALIEARELIAEGAVQISLDAVTRLEGKMQIERDEKVKIVTNLLTICTGEENAKPVLTL
jgi:regulator of protease activity HflC (stomatin/prohibitin superfamily)